MATRGRCSRAGGPRRELREPWPPAPAPGDRGPRPPAPAPALRAPPHHTENGLSGSVEPRRRPVLGSLLARLADTADPAAVLVVAKMDRLGRSVIDVLGLCETAERQGWSLVMLEPAIDATTAAGRSMLGMMAVMAQFERDMAGERTREALAAKRQRDPQWRAGPGGIDPDTIGRIGILRESGCTWQAIADALNADQTPTATGKGRWSITQARRYWNEYQNT